MKRTLKKTGYFKSFDKHEIYFETRGTGEVIIFIYGIACLMNHWHNQTKYFSSQFKAVTFDMRGHHKTKRPALPENISLESLAKDLKYLVEYLGVKKAHFVGHSFGAQVILKGYEMFPEIFESIIFINGFAKNPVKGMFGLNVVDKIYYFINNQYRANPQLWKTLWRAGVDNPLAVSITILAGGFNGKLTSLKDIQVYIKGVSNLDLDSFLRLFEELMNFDGEPILGKIEVPALVISGENDHITPEKFQLKMSQEIPNAEYLCVPYGSHCTQLDFPEFVNLRMDKFYKNHWSN